LKGPARLLAFILQERLEHSPPGIQHGLRHPCLRKVKTTHIAHDYLLIGGFNGSMQHLTILLGGEAYEEAEEMVDSS
jgi:hypothetical protein